MHRYFTSAAHVQNDRGFIHKRLKALAQTRPGISKCESSLSVAAKAILSTDQFKSCTISCEAIVQYEQFYRTLTKSSDSGRWAIREALRVIFLCSNEAFRQEHYHDLMHRYYEMLPAGCIDRTDFELEAKLALPLVKMEVLQLRLDPELVANLKDFFRCLRLNREDVYAVLRTKLGTSRYALKSYTLDPLDDISGNLGEYFKLRVTLASPACSTLDFFVKFLTPKSPVLLELAQSGISKKEEFFYTQYVPLLERHGIRFLDCVPKCYFSRANDVLVLDDMTSLGYRPAASADLSVETVVKVVRQLAKFHAAGLLLEQILSDRCGCRIALDQVFGEYLRELFYEPRDDPNLKLSFDAGLHSVHHLLGKFPDLTPNGICDDDVRAFIDTVWQSSFDKVQKSKVLRNAMCHGDVHVSNTLYKSGPSDADVVLIDFQMLRYCPPVHDLLFFVYQNLTRNGRKLHMRALCDKYYEELSGRITEHGYDIRQVYPRSDFETSLKYMKSQAITQVLYYTPFIKLPLALKREVLQDGEKATQFLFHKRWKLLDMALEDDAFKTDMRGLMEDLVEMFYNKEGGILK